MSVSRVLNPIFLSSRKPVAAPRSPHLQRVREEATGGHPSDSMQSFLAAEQRAQQGGSRPTTGNRGADVADAVKNWFAANIGK